MTVCTAAAAASAQFRIDYLRVNRGLYLVLRSNHVFVSPQPPPNMSGLSRANLQKMLEEQGEVPPRTWTRAELMLRVEELTNTNMSKAKAASKDLTSYRHLVQELNRVSRKKAELQEFCKDKLLMNVNYNLTIPQLMREAMIKIYVVSQPEPADPLGFGKHAALSYSEVKNKHPQYCEWAITTAREGPCDPRLKRFAGWLSNDAQLVQTATQEWELKMAQSEENHRVVAPKAPTPKPKTMMRSSAYSSAEEETGSVTLAGYQLQSLVSTIEDLKEEVSILKGERPRKKVQNEESLSVVSDFSMVGPRTPEP